MLPASSVVGAFHHVPAGTLLDPAADTVDMDVLVLGDNRAATDLVIALAGEIPGMRGIFGGRLRNLRSDERPAHPRLQQLNRVMEKCSWVQWNRL